MNNGHSLNGYRAEFMTITPQIAADWLTKLAPNRRMNERVVQRHADTFTRGRHRVNGESIKFSTDDLVIDGQHRLAGAVRANKSFESLVVWGIQPEHVTIIDGVRRRTMGHNLVMLGEKNATNLGALICHVWRDKNELPPFIGRPGLTDLEGNSWALFVSMSGVWPTASRHVPCNSAGAGTGLDDGR